MAYLISVHNIPIALASLVPNYRFAL